MSIHPIDLVRLALAGALVFQSAQQVYVAANRRDFRYVLPALWCLVGAIALGGRFILRHAAEPVDAVAWTRLSAAALLALPPVAIAAIHTLMDREPPLVSRVVFIASVIPVVGATSSWFLQDTAVLGRDLFGVEFWIAERGPLFWLVYVVVPVAVVDCLYLIRLTGGFGGRRAERLLMVFVGVAGALGLAAAALVRAGYPSPQIAELAIPFVAWAFTYGFARQEHVHRLQLAASGERQQRFIAASLAAQEREREHLARDLGETIGESLGWLVAELDTADAEALGGDGARAQALRSRTRDILDDVRRTARSLHPSVLVDLGLEQALRSNGREFAAAHGVDVDVHVRGADEPLPRLIEITLYRTAQEALAALTRPGGATAVSVTVEVARGRARLVVDCDAAGASRSACEELLAFARDRVAMLGGAIEVEVGRGGAAVYATLPATIDAGGRAEVSG